MGEAIMKFLKNRMFKKILLIIAIAVAVFFFVFGGGSYNEVLKKGSYQEEDNSNAPYVADTVMEEAISATMEEDTEIKDIKTVPSADGGYKLDIDLDEITKNIIETLDDNQGGLENYFSYKNMEEYLKKMIKAELVTQYPDLRSADKIGTPTSDENEFQGVIKFVRHKNDGTTQVLQYIPLGDSTSATGDTLNGKINQANQSGTAANDILNYFSIDRDGNLIVAKSIQTITKTAEGNYATEYKANNETVDYMSTDKAYVDSAPQQVSYLYSKHTIDYKTVMTQYTMPFEYLWAFLVASRDEEFISDLADLVLESEIEVGIYDGQEISEDLSINCYNTNNWEKRRLVEIEKTYNFQTRRYEKTNEEFGSWSEPATITTIHNYTGSYTKRTTDILTIKITKADVWYMESIASFVQETTGPSNPELANQEITRHSEQDETLASGSSPSGEIHYVTGVEQEVPPEDLPENLPSDVKLYKRTDYLRQTKKNQHASLFASNLTRTEYVSSGTPQIKEKTDNTLKEGDEGYPNFSTIYMSSDAARNNITGAEDWLFEVLENNETTVNMLELTKYMLYCATGTDFGVKTFDFKIYNSRDFTEVGLGGSDLLIEYIHMWEHASPPPTNADGTKYIVENDGYGHPTVGYGIDIHNSGYKQQFLDAGYSIEIGAEIDIEFVDAIEDEIIGNKIAEIKSRTEGLNLTTYQMNALVSRAYNCGTSGALGTRNGKDFVQAYTDYWNPEDDQFEEKNPDANFNHSLYTNYMSVPVYSAGEYSYGLERRRRSEWTLFQTGYYDVLNRWQASGDAIVESAYAVADHFINSGVTVHYAGDDVNGATNNGRSCIYGNIEGSYRIPIENPQRFGVVCATFVSLALRDAGIFSDDTINGYYYNSCGSGGVTSMLQDAGWQRITSYSELQPGDIWFEPGHVAIYVGDGKYIDQAYCVITSSGKDNRGKLRTASSGKFSYAYRYSN